MVTEPHTIGSKSQVLIWVVLAIVVLLGIYLTV